jgi:GTP-binding protein
MPDPTQFDPRYQRAHFIGSAAHLVQAPPDLGWEVAFAGRSNAGKSTAINVICQQKSLARTSKVPGRTRLLNFFAVDDQRRLVDLPGYGYAKVPEPVLRQWRALLEGYLQQRRCLKGLILLMDIRHPVTEFDTVMLDWAGHCGLPVHILLTKADKLGRGTAQGTLLAVNRTIGEYGAAVSAQLFSALTRQGLSGAYSVLNRWLELPGNDSTG